MRNNANGAARKALQPPRTLTFNVTWGIGSLGSACYKAVKYESFSASGVTDM